MNEDWDSRRTWVLHGAGGWYIGLLWRITDATHIDSTRSEWIGDMVEFFPHYTKIPFMSPDDCASLNAADLTEALLYINPEATLSQIGETHFLSLRKLQLCFKPTCKTLMQLQGCYRRHQHKVEGIQKHQGCTLLHHQGWHV